MNRKSQITLYITIGIVLLLTISLVTYFATKQIIKPVSFTKQESAVKMYAEDCIKQTAVEALKKIGANAGYIDINDAKSSQRSFNLDTRPSEGDLLIMSEIGTYAIPYWWYLKSPNKCKKCFATTQNIPTIDHIKEQIDDYVSQNVLSCMDFSEFEKQNIIVKTPSSISVETYITEGVTRIVADYPLEITSKGVKTTIDKLETPVNINFRGMYDLARKISIEEKEKAIFEKTIMHLIGAYSGVDFSKLPPVGAITHSSVIVNWPKIMVKQKIEQILRSYIPLIQIAYTKDSKEIKKPGASLHEQGVFKALYLKFLEKDYPFKVSFSYLDWPIYFDLSPAAGDLLKPEVYIQNFFFDIATIQTNTYDTFYDISTPILMEIRDDNALGGEGYSLMVALEANIRDNKNIPEWHRGEGTVGAWDPEHGENKVEFERKKPFKCEETDDDKWICPLTEIIYDEISQCSETCYETEKVSEELTAAQTMFCNEEQKLSGMIEVKVLDAVTKNPVSDASISYVCGNYMTCTLGGTDTNGMFASKFPVCIGGLLEVKEKNFYQERIRITTNIGTKENYTIYLEPFREFNTRVKKIEINLHEDRKEEDDKITRTYTKSVSRPKLLRKNQQAMFLIEKVKEHSFDTNLIQALMFDGPSSAKQKMKLVPGKYKVTAYYVDKNGVIIPAECKKICTDYEISDTDLLIQKAVGSLSFEQLEYEVEAECSEYTYLPENDIDITPARLGGIFIDSENGYWEVSRDTINSTFGIIDFTILKFPTPTCTDIDSCILDQCIGMDQMTKDREYSDEYRGLIGPRIS